MKRLIIFLIRRRLGLKKYQTFRFVNQKSFADRYFFTDTVVMKIEGNKIRPSSVSLNWLLNEGCEIKKLESFEEG